MNTSPLDSPAAVRVALKKLQRLIRIGLTGTDTVQQLKASVVSELRRLGSVPASLFTETERLRLVTLRAEYQYTLGSPAAAADEIAASAGELVKRLEWWYADAANRRFLQNDDFSLLRQQVWALLAYAFYYSYSSGRVSEALRLLSIVAELITAELAIPGERPPHGTRSRLHYFLGHCYRAQRDFVAAEQHFLISQEHAYKRLKRELDDHSATDTNHYEEICFSIVCTGRILSGLAWAFLQQGRLHRARHLLYGAQTLLLPTGQSGLRLFVATLLGVTERRLAKPGGHEWQESLNVLDDCYGQYRAISDHLGARRCAHEMARAFLDLHAATRDSDALARADRWTRALDELSAEYSSPARLAITIRSHLLDAQRLVRFGDETNIAEARRLVDAARVIGSKDAVKSIDLDADINLVDGIVMYAEKRLRDAENMLRSLCDESRTRNDIVLESECHIRLAAINAGLDLVAEAHEDLERWRQLAPRVDNHHLKVLEDMTLELVANASTLQLIFDVKDLRPDSLHQAEATVKRALARLALARCKTKKEAAKMLGCHRDTLSEMLEYKTSMF